MYSLLPMNRGTFYTGRSDAGRGIYFNWNENIVYITYFCMIFLAYRYGSRYILLLGWFAALMFINGNARRIYWKNHKSLARTVRRLLFLIPLYSVLVYGFHGEFRTGTLPYIFMGAAFSLLLILTAYRSWRLALAEEVILMEPEDTYDQYLTRILYLTGTAVGEELFFRNFMIGYVGAGQPVIMVLFSTLGFVTAHVGNKWGNAFHRGDIVRQSVFSLVSGILFLVSGSVLPCIAAHLAFNFPYVLKEVKCIYYKKMHLFKIRKEQQSVNG